MKKSMFMFVVVLATCGTMSAMVVPFDIGFEASEGYTAGVLIENQGISDWNWSTTSNTYVVNTNAYAGTQSLRFGAANGYGGICRLLNTTGDPTSGTVMLQFYVYMGATNTGDTNIYFGGDGAASAIQGILFDYSEGIVYAGYNTQRIATTFSYSANEWYKVSIVESYGQSNYGSSDYYINDTLIASDIRDDVTGTSGISVIYFSAANCGGGSPAGDHYAYLDNFSISVIPEPSSMMLLGCITSCILYRKTDPKKHNYNT